MPSFYSVIQYFPDPVRGECINIGVAVWPSTGGVARVQFLQDWARVEAFAGESIQFLKDYAVERAAIRPEFSRVARTSGAAGAPMSSIEYTPPRASLESVDETLEYVARRFLVGVKG